MLKVEDKSTMHDFDLIGPGVDEEATGLVCIRTRSSVTVIVFSPTKSTPYTAPCSRTPMASRATFPVSWAAAPLPTW
jgi:hypothetical protein